MRSLFYVALVLLALSSCEKAMETSSPDKTISPATGEFQDFLIPKGAHYSNGNTIRKTNPEGIRFDVKFDSSCRYTNMIPENSFDINKLYGFSDGGFDHHVNSARFGWLWNGKAIEVHAYVYNDKQRRSKLLGTAGIGEITSMALTVKPGYYLFQLNDKTDSLSRVVEGNMINGYQLYPYFGGDETAPHDIHIFIRETGTKLTS